jgi:hypothetical protein
MQHDATQATRLKKKLIKKFKVSFTTLDHHHPKKENSHNFNRGHHEPAPTIAPLWMNDKWSGNSFLFTIFRPIYLYMRPSSYKIGYQGETEY